MNIGIDIDGVLCSEDLFQLIYGIKFCYQNNINCRILSPFSSETKDRFLWSSEEDKRFWKENYLYYLTTSEFLYPDAPKVIRSLYQDGHKIYLISYRKQSLLNKLGIHENMESLTIDWLKRNNIPFHQLILAKKTKQYYIRQLNISLMIDDNPKTLEELSHYITVIGFRAHCNLQYLLPNVVMVSSWKELEDKLKDENNHFLFTTIS